MCDVLLYQGIIELPTTIVSDNPFWKALPKDEKRRGKWLFGKRRYLSGELFLCDEIQIDERGNEKNPLGFFDKPIEVPVIYQNGRPWMSLIPHEIATMKKAIEEAKGRVLTYGLGLGYFAVMAALKNDVKSVTVVERDYRAIELFQEYIAPLFPEAKKIHIIRMDALKHAQTIQGHQYDFVFVDIWHNGDDGWEPYIAFRHCFAKMPDPKVAYWIEKTLLEFIRRAAIIVLAEVEDGATDEDFSIAANPEEKLLNSIYRLFRQKRFEIDLSDEVLRKYAEILDI